MLLIVSYLILSYLEHKAPDAPGYWLLLGDWYDPEGNLYPDNGATELKNSMVLQTLLPKLESFGYQVTIGFHIDHDTCLRNETLFFSNSKFHKEYLNDYFGENGSFWVDEGLPVESQYICRLVPDRNKLPQKHLHFPITRPVVPTTASAPPVDQLSAVAKVIP